MNPSKISGLALAAATAALFSVVSVAHEGEHGDKVKCEGVNSCKGMGYLEMSKKECDAAKEKMKADAAK